jgi:hypothetical protein
MGLDMYLRARKYTYRRDLMTDTPSEAYKSITSVLPVGLVEEDGFTGAEVTATIAYWRKANQIHSWFVRNVQEGRDNCENYPVPVAKLDELLQLVTKVLDNHTKEYAHKYLAPEQGFFFGTYEVDEWYWEQLEYTKKRLTEILKIHHANLDQNIYYEYQSSW